VNFDGTYQVCVRNIDGSGFRRLTNPSSIFRQDNDFPSLNSKGVIAFSCLDDKQVYQICVINVDGSGYKKLTNSSTNYQVEQINDSGTIIYRCGTDSGNSNRICSISDDGTKLTELYSNNAFGVDIGTSSINLTGIIVFGCPINNNQGDVCAINADSTGMHRLTSSGLNGSPAINDNGRIAYVCNRPINLNQICAVNLDGSNDQQLTHFTTEYLGIGFLLIINSKGRILFPCYPSNETPIVLEICAINDDGSNFKQLTHAGSNAYWASMNASSQIAFNCPINGAIQICLMNDDGTDSAPLTNGNLYNMSPSIR
jgi:hypothetical protein